MRSKALWSETQPSVKAMASQQPFACDQMEFPEWLQYIFIPRLTLLLEQQADLPDNSDIAPMAEYFFSLNGIDASDLVGIIRKIDALLTAG